VPGLRGAHRLSWASSPRRPSGGGRAGRSSPNLKFITFFPRPSGGGFSPHFDLAGLEVAVNDAFVRRGLQSLGYCLAMASASFRGRQRPLPDWLFFESRPAHPVPWPARAHPVRFSTAIDGGDVGVVLACQHRASTLGSRHVSASLANSGEQPFSGLTSRPSVDRGPRYLRPSHPPAPAAQDRIGSQTMPADRSMASHSILLCRSLG